MHIKGIFVHCTTAITIHVISKRLTRISVFGRVFTDAKKEDQQQVKILQLQILLIDSIKIISKNSTIN